MNKTPLRESFLRQKWTKFYTNAPPEMFQMWNIIRIIKCIQHESDHHQLTAASRAPLSHSLMIMSGIPAVANQDFEYSKRLKDAGRTVAHVTAGQVDKQSTLLMVAIDVTKEDVIVCCTDLNCDLRFVDRFGRMRFGSSIFCWLKPNALQANATAPGNALAESKITMKRSTKNEQQYTNETNHLIATVKLIKWLRGATQSPNTNNNGWIMCKPQS